MIELAANAPAVGDYNGDMNGIELLDSMGARVVLLMKHKRLTGGCRTRRPQHQPAHCQRPR